MELMKEIPDKSINMILCDLPYGITSCKWDENLPLGNLWLQYKRILKENGLVVLTAFQPFTTNLINSNKEWFKYNWIWIKSVATGHLNAKKQPLRTYEDICIFYKQQPTYNPILTKKEDKHIRRNNTKSSNNNINIYGNQNMINSKDNREIPSDKNYPKNILYFKSNYRQKILHPTQKPLNLFKYMIKTYTNELDLVLDNCIGSGTTAVACKQLNRRFIGIEIEEKYVKIAESRLKQEVLHNLK